MKLNSNRSLNIVLVETDYLLGRGTATLIEQFAGHQVQVTDAPAEVVRVCETDAIDLVMLNMNLLHGANPGMSSQELSHHLKHNPQTAHIPVMLTTAYETQSDRQTLLDTFEADEVCLQPIVDYQTLLATIELTCG